MSVNIGNNNKISKSNISEQHNVDKSENHTNTTMIIGIIKRYLFNIFELGFRE